MTGNEIPKENTHYSCTAAICIDSVIKLEGENYPQVNLEQFFTHQILVFFVCFLRISFFNISKIFMLNT